MTSKEIQVLVLDDEVNILHSLTRVFLSEPYGVFTTDSPEQAADILMNTNIKVLMSDHRMPKITGVEFCRKAKELKPDCIRILFTGFADLQAAEDAINTGEVYRFVNKPWNDEELKATIRDAIKHYDLADENRRLLELTRRQNEELAVANKKLAVLYERQKEFTSTVSHELRTPLASMKMAIDIILKGMEGEVNDGQKRHLLIAKNNVDRLWRLTTEVLDLSKIESCCDDFILEDCRINDLISEASSMQRISAQEKGLSFRLELDDKVGLVKANPDKLNQVINNLINNAVKFTDKGEIIVASRFDPENKRVAVCVSDTGNGIAKGDLDKLFHKFSQLGSAAQRKTGGTGLGLAICKEIISRHHGEIWAESELGKGTRFVFTLPV